MKSNLTRKKNGSYVLKHKTIKAKKDDCTECGQNPKKQTTWFDVQTYI